MQGYTHQYDPITDKRIKKRMKKPKDIGAPTKCTTKLIHKIVPIIEQGNLPEVAAASCGITKQTFVAWLKLGHDEPRSIYRKFSQAVFSAQAEAQRRLLKVLENASQGTSTVTLVKDEHGNQLYDKDGLPLHTKPIQPDWQAAAWLLERLNRDAFGKKDLHEHKHESNQPIVQITLPSNLRDLPVIDVTDTSSLQLNAPGSQTGSTPRDTPMGTPSQAVNIALPSNKR